MTVTIVLLLQYSPNIKNENSKSWDQTHIINNKRILNNKLQGFSRPTIDIDALKSKLNSYKNDFLIKALEKNHQIKNKVITSVKSNYSEFNSISDLRSVHYKPVNWQPEITPNQKKKFVNESQESSTAYRYEPSFISMSVSCLQSSA